MAPHERETRGAKMDFPHEGNSGRLLRLTDPGPLVAIPVRARGGPPVQRSSKSRSRAGALGRTCLSSR
jgi:hypothetical protein